MATEDCSLLGILQQGEKPADDGVPGGLVAGEFQEEEEAPLSLFAQSPSLDLRLHEQRHEIIGGRTAAILLQTRQVFHHLPDRCKAIFALAVTPTSTLGDGVTPHLDEMLVHPGHAEKFTYHVAGQKSGDILHKIDHVSTGEIIEYRRREC